MVHLVHAHCPFCCRLLFLVTQTSHALRSWFWIRSVCAWTHSSASWFCTRNSGSPPQFPAAYIYVTCPHYVFEPPTYGWLPHPGCYPHTAANTARLRVAAVHTCTALLLAKGQERKKKEEGAAARHAASGRGHRRYGGAHTAAGRHRLPHAVRAWRARAAALLRAQGAAHATLRAA